MASGIAIGAQQRLGEVAPPPKPSAVIKGVVIDLQTRVPVRYATVRLETAEGRGIARTVAADATGQFAFGELPGGRYLLSASRPDYLPATLGQARQRGPGTPIEVADGETRDNVGIPMTRGGVISGRVFDDYGDPVVDAQVRAMQYRIADGNRTLAVMAAGSTDDQGAFRLFLLEPGQYYVHAQRGALDGGPGELAGPLDTYYPNTTDASAAERVTVLAGKETPAVDVTLVSGKLARLRGRALMSTGQPFVDAMVMMHTRLGPVMSSTSGALVKPDGSFELGGVPPGEYLIAVTPRAARPNDDIERARAEVEVTGEDIDGLLLVGVRGAILRGSVITESGEPVPLSPKSIQLQFAPARNERGGYVNPSLVGEDYTFEMKNLFGRYRLDAAFSSATGQWATKMIRWRGEDVTHEAFEFRGQLIEGVEVVLSNQWATLSGTIRDHADGPAADTPVVLFPADDTRRIPNSRYLRGMRTDRQGRFAFSWLLPGEYLIATPEDLESNQWNDLELLKALADRAARVTIAHDDDRVVELRIRTP